MNAGYACVIIAMIIIFILGPFGWILAVPLALGAFILGIVGLTKGDTNKGVMLLIASIIGPGAAQLIWFLILASSFG